MMQFDFIDKALSFLYPRHCPICDELVKNGELVHSECQKKVRLISGSKCMKCGKQLGMGNDSEYCSDCVRIKHRFERNFGVFQYRSISGSIYKFKYMGRQEYADYYARVTAKKLSKKIKQLGVEAIIPVPMYSGKKKQRGYNQAEVYAKKLARELRIEYRDDIIVRARPTLPMKELDARGRRINLKKAFNIVRNDVKFKCILIIDDIYTTGSTIDEIAHEFQMAGVENVYSLTLAIGQTT